MTPTVEIRRVFVYNIVKKIWGDNMLTEILLIICVVLLIVLIVLTLTKSKSDNNQRLEELSRQMSELTDKNYQQQIKILETLSKNTATQTDAVTKAVNSMQESNENKLD